MELTPCSSALDFWHFLVELDIFPLHISSISILNFYYSLIFSQFEIENIIYVPFIQVIQVFKIFFVIFQIWYWPNHRDWFPKFANGLNIKIDIVHKACIWVTKVSFCQNDPIIGESFWQKSSLVPLIFFEICLFWYFANSQILGISLYLTFKLVSGFRMGSLMTWKSAINPPL